MDSSPANNNVVDIPWILVIIVLFLLGITVWHLFLSKKARVSRALKKVPLVKISDAWRHTGVVRLEGRLRFPEEKPIVSPFTNRACAYYEVEVRERLSGGAKGQWTTVLKESDSIDFYIEDDTGRARVEMEHPLLVLLTMDTQFVSGTFDDVDPEIEEFLNSRGLTKSHMEYTEGVLEEGEQVAVAGHCHSAPPLNPEASGAEKSVVIRTDPTCPLVVTDDTELTERCSS